MAYTSSSPVKCSAIAFAASATSSLPVERRYLSIDSSYPNVEVVAPISAPILHIVPFPVQDIDFAPSPKYSTIAPVPPFTVRIPATFKITSFGELQPLKRPVSLTPINLGNFSSQAIPAITSTASAPPTPMATIPSPPALTV